MQSTGGPDERLGGPPRGFVCHGQEEVPRRHLNGGGTVLCRYIQNSKDPAHCGVSISYSLIMHPRAFQSFTTINSQ